MGKMNKLKAALVENHGDSIEINMRKGRPSTCEIEVDGFLVFSKLENKGKRGLPHQDILVEAIGNCLAGKQEKVEM